MFRRRIVTLCWGLLALATEVAAEPAPTAEVLSVQHQLGASDARLGIAVHVKGDRVFLWSCRGLCEAKKPTRVVSLPEEVPGKVSASILRGFTEEAMWLKWGSEDRFYSLIVVGGETSSDASGEPRVVLKGWSSLADDAETRLVHERDDNGDRLMLLAGRSEAVCGRTAARTARVFTPETGRFSAVRASALSMKERLAAPSWTAKPFGEVDDKLLVGLDTRTEGSADAPVDGDRDEGWDAGFEFVDLRPPAGVELSRVVVELEQALREPAAMYLATREGLFQVEFSPHAGKHYVIDVPTESASCVALVQPRSPAPVVEVMALGGDAVSTEALVAALDEDDPELAAAALRLRGDEAATELAARISGMSKDGRRRAFEVAARLPRASGLPVFAAALESEDEKERELAQEMLEQAGEVAGPAIWARLKQAGDGTEGALVVALVNTAPKFAARALPQLLESERASRRSRMRSALAHLYDEDASRPTLQRLIASLAGGQESLSSDARVELVRALGPELMKSPGAVQLVEKLVREADFARAYRLTPLAVPLVSKSKVVREQIREWLLGQLGGDPSIAERHALSLRILESFLGGANDRAMSPFKNAVLRRLDSENMRVRRAALRVAAQLGLDAPEASDPILRLLLRDDWPQVRAAAADPAAELVRQEGASSRVLRAMLRRLKRDDHPSVRRALARALGDIDEDDVTLALRKSLAKDDTHLVRAEAALSLGKLCDVGSVNVLTKNARRLASGMPSEGQIELGLASVSALARIAPADLERLLGPLLSEEAPTLIRQRVLRRIEAVRSSRSGVCKR